MLLSIIPNETSVGATAFAVALEFVMVMWVFGVRRPPHKLSSQAYIVACLLCLSHYLFCMVGGDYFTYKDTVENSGFTNLLLYSSTEFHIELPYVAIINFVNNNYLLFRLVVFGGALLLFLVTSVRFELNKNTFIFYLAIFVVPFTSTSRLALALATAFFGYSLIIKPFEYSKYLSIVLGVVLCYLSIWLHRSAPFLLLILPFALIDIKKRTIPVLFLMIPVIIFFVSTGITDYIFSLDSTAEDSFIDAHTAQIYLSSDKKFSNKGPGELIRLFLSYLSYALIFYDMVRLIWYRTYKLFPNHIQKLCNVVLLVIIASVVFLLMPGANTYKTFERLIAFSIVPAAFVLSYQLSINNEKKLVNTINTAILSWVIYDMAYMLYLDIH